MKKILFVFLIVLAIIFYFLFFGKNESKNSQKKVQSFSPSPSVRPLAKEESLVFIPYWARSVDITNLPFDSLVYFGVKPDTGGIDKNDPGFLGLKKFTEIKEGKKSYLVLRMLDQKVNEKVLVDKSLNEKIIGETLEIAKNNSFNGVVLDLEVSSMPFTSLTNSINDFVSVFYREAKNKKLKFSIMLYGDTFYKLRPYDVLNLNKNSDGIFIMAYDFHKAGGKPGPNFPLSGKEKYGYDFRTMITDFLNFVPKEKITVVFGMFGYDWQKDDNTGSTAKALSLNEIRSTFDGCLVNCKLTIDNLSTESQILYKDNSLKEHEVWFETMESVSKKKEFLQEKEINKIAFWAYSYF